MCDKVAGDEWKILWPDQTVESSTPLVENLYAEALEDKTITAASVPMMLRTTPTRGTRRDEGEKNAAKRRRVGLSYWHRSNDRRLRQKIYRDWLHTGVMALSPWATGFVNTSGQGRPPAERFAYFQHVNPRHLYPLSWDNRGMLASGLVMRRRRLLDMIADWGDLPIFFQFARRFAESSVPIHAVWVEEIWYFDQTQWACAVGASTNVPAQWSGAMMGPASDPAHGGQIVSWIAAPSNHNLGACPLKATARVTYNDSPRGALVDILPALRTAQNFMARILDDLNMAIYAPVVLDNIENPEEYGLGAVLVGTGQGDAKIMRDRPPVNFEAQQTVNAVLDSARRQAFEPAQRSGEAGASIVSAKGTISLMGTFNAELATMQGDGEELFSAATSATAALDETWCAGVKQINVSDSTGELVDETYDPAQLFKGDWRFVATYGDRTGLDEQAHLTKLAIVRNMSGMSLRSFMQKSGMVDDVMDEETEITIEKMVTLFTDVLLPQEIQAGNKEAMLAFIDLIDTDKKSARQAMFDTIRKAKIAPAQGGGGEFGSGQRADIVRMMRSMASGGVPGNAEGLPSADMALPPPDRRALAETAPGGTAA